MAQMKTTCCGVRRRTALDQACLCGTTMPDYSTRQVRRIADIVLGENVSGEKASAVLLALIVGPCDACGSFSDPAKSGRGLSACGSSAEDMLSLLDPADRSAFCEMRRTLRGNDARSASVRRVFCGELPPVAKDASEKRFGMSGLRRIPSRSCPRRTLDPRPDLRRKGTSRHIIPAVEFGSSNSVNPAPGYPNGAATCRRDTLDHAAKRLFSLGGINRSPRKRRRERSDRNGNQPLFRIPKGNYMSTDEQLRNRGPGEAQSDDSASDPRSSKNGVDNDAARSAGGKPRKPSSQKRIRAFVWDAVKREVADKTRTITAWENAPTSPEKQFTGLESKIKSDIKSVDHLQILDRPSSEIVEPRVSVHAENRLTLWLPFDTPFNAYWAAESALDRYGINAAKIDDRIGRIIITSREPADYGYAPFIKRSFTAKDRRAKTSRQSETKHFLHYLQYVSAKRTGDVAQDEFELKLLFTVSNCPDVQFRASEELIRHAANNGFLHRPLEEAFEDFKELWEVFRTGRCPFFPPTRWDVITMLRERGHLLPTDKKQSALRPLLSSASFNDIARILENTRLCSGDAIRSSSRTSDAVRARYIAAHIMRWTTSKTVAQIGAALGDRDHSSVVHGLRQIDAWAKKRPVNARFLDMFCRLADNVGICNALRGDPEMKKRLACIPPLAKPGKTSDRNSTAGISGRNRVS